MPCAHATDVDYIANVCVWALRSGKLDAVTHFWHTYRDDDDGKIGDNSNNLKRFTCTRRHGKNIKKIFTLCLWYIFTRASIPRKEYIEKQP